MLSNFFNRYKYYLLAALGVFIVLSVLLIIFSSGPQQGAFNYQVF